MKIAEIYKKYHIPENLQMHMLRVAACGCVIRDNWIGEQIDFDNLTKILLLHDMGNIAKITDDQNSDEDFRKFRDSCICKYGKDDHVINEAIVREIGLGEKEIYIMAQKIFMNNDITKASDSYITKIAAYCDQRVAPNGVYGLKERLEEAKERYKDKPGTSMNNPKTNYLIECALEIERQIMRYCKISPSDINDNTIKKYINKLFHLDIICY